MDDGACLFRTALLYFSTFFYLVERAQHSMHMRRDVRPEDSPSFDLGTITPADISAVLWILGLKNI